MTPADSGNPVPRLASPFMEQSKLLEDTSAHVTQMTALYQATDGYLASLDNSVNIVSTAKTPEDRPEPSTSFNTLSPTRSCSMESSAPHRPPRPMVSESSAGRQVPSIWKSLSTDGVTGCIDHQRITVCPTRPGNTQASLQIYRADGFSDFAPDPHSQNRSSSYGIPDLIFAGASRFFPDLLTRLTAISMIIFTATTVAEMLHSKLSYCPCTDEDLWQFEDQKHALLGHVIDLFPMFAGNRQEVQCQRSKYAFELLKAALEDLGQSATFKILDNHPNGTRAMQCVAASLRRLEPNPADVVGTWAWETFVEPASRHGPLTGEVPMQSPSEMTPAPSTVEPQSTSSCQGLPERGRPEEEKNVRQAHAKISEKTSSHDCAADSSRGGFAEATHEDRHADIRLLPFTTDGRTIDNVVHHGSDIADSQASPGSVRSSRPPASIITISDSEDEPERQSSRRSARTTAHTNVDYNQKRHILDQYLEDLEGTNTERIGPPRKRQRRNGGSTKSGGSNKSAQ